MSAAGERWGPPSDRSGFALVAIRSEPAPPRDLVARVARLAAALGVPVQAVRADRVLSRAHVAMAADHARRADVARRLRATDPAVEFLLYLAGESQIKPALSALGVPAARDAPVVLVALGDVGADALAAQAQEVGLAVAAVGDDVRFHADAARAWWVERLPPPPGAARDDLEARILARLATLTLP